MSAKNTPPWAADTSKEAVHARVGVGGHSTPPVKPGAPVGGDSRKPASSESEIKARTGSNR